MTEKQTGYCSQPNSTVLHYNEDPGCFLHNQIFGPSRYSGDSFTLQDFVITKVPRRDCYKTVSSGIDIKN